MQVISSGLGFCLLFNSLESVHNHISNLKAMAEHMEKGNAPAPYLFHIHDKGISPDTVEEYLIDLKARFIASEPTSEINPEKHQGTGP